MLRHDRGFGLRQILHRSNQFEPTAELLAGPGDICPCPVELGQGRATTQSIAQGEIILGCSVSIERLQEVDEFKVVIDEASRGKLKPTGFDLTGELGQLPIGCPGLGQSLRLVKEAVVVTDEVQNDQSFLPGGPAEPTTELLQEQDLGFRRTQHQHGVDAGEIDAFIEQIDRENDLQAPISKLLKSLASPHGGAGLDGCGSDSGPDELLSHVLCMPDRDAEGQGLALRPVLPLLQGVACTGRVRRA
jgi:hypothetical protein